MKELTREVVIMFNESEQLIKKEYEESLVIAMESKFYKKLENRLDGLRVMAIKCVDKPKDFEAAYKSARSFGDALNAMSISDCKIKQHVDFLVNLAKLGAPTI